MARGTCLYGAGRSLPYSRCGRRLGGRRFDRDLRDCLALGSGHRDRLRLRCGHRDRCSFRSRHRDRSRRSIRCRLRLRSRRLRRRRRCGSGCGGRCRRYRSRDNGSEDLWLRCLMRLVRLGHSYILLGGRVHDRCGIELLGYICVSVETVQLAQNIEQHGRRKDPAGQGFGLGISDGVRQRGKGALTIP